MFETIKNIIIKWDPVGLMDFSPTDEYDYECKKIIDEYEKKTKPLEDIIYTVFSDSFEDAFGLDKENCIDIAFEIKQILDKGDSTGTIREQSGEQSGDGSMIEP